MDDLTQPPVEQQQPISPRPFLIQKFPWRLAIFLVVISTVISSSALYALVNSGSNKKAKQNTYVASPTPQPTVVQDETRNWKTYTSNDWGFTFQYPPEWDIKVYTNFLDLKYNTSPQASLIYHDNPKDLSLEEIDKENAIKDKERGVGVDTPKLTPSNYTTVNLKGGSTAYYEKEYFCEPTICERHIIKSDKKVIEIVIFPRSSQSKSIIDQILSTFKFLDQGQNVTNESEVAKICKDVLKEPTNQQAGITFQRSYCQGDLCNDAKTKEQCESRDVIRIEKNMVTSGKDGRVDCGWVNPVETMHFCAPFN